MLLLQNYYLLVVVLYAGFLIFNCSADISDYLPLYGKQIGTRCYSNSECTYGGHAYCQIISPTCGTGVCECVPGYAVDVNDGVCKRAVKITQTCSSLGVGDFCVTENSVCEGGWCKCQPGYKRNYNGDECVSELQAILLGDICRSDEECLKNMECSDGRCRCRPGYQAYTQYECRQREIGDKCKTDPDCSAIPNAICGTTDGGDSKTCRCGSDYKQVPYIKSLDTYYQTPHNACIPVAESQRSEAESCKKEIEPTRTAVCRVPFLCADCGPSAAGTYCLRLVPTYLEGGASSKLMAGDRIFYTALIIPTVGLLIKFMAMAGLGDGQVEINSAH